MWTNFMVWTTNLFGDVRRDEDGQALVEYGLLVGLIAVICVAAVTLVGLDVQGYFEDIAAALV